MDQFATKIEALEHHWMRAWMHRDRAAMKAVTERDFIFMLGGTKGVILDRASWLDAATTRFRCSAYRFGNIYVRRHGGVTIFAAPLTIEAEIDGIAFSGDAWVTDLWQRSAIKRKWRLIERVLARPDTAAELPAAIRSLQLWR